MSGEPGKSTDSLAVVQQRLGQRVGAGGDQGLPLSRSTAHPGLLASAGRNVLRRAEGPGRLEVAGDGAPLRQVRYGKSVGRHVSNRDGP